MAFISDVIDSSLLTTGMFNLISAGCGSGKTYWVINNLLKQFPEVKPPEVLFVTSRSVTKDQQSRNAGTSKLLNRDDKILQYWNGLKDEESILGDYGILIATYDQLIRMITQGYGENVEVLERIKIIILDECHVLFSDEFIQRISALRLWLRELAYGKRKLLIGLSATTHIIEHYSDSWGIPINRINNIPIVGYQAKQMICTNFDTIPYLISANKLPGKTIIMCHSIRDCNVLASRLSNAAVVVSPHSEHFTEEMGRIRDYIVKNETLPPTFFTPSGEERDLDVLISTSTLREGFNLREKSGVRNVITCLTDELHVSQFAGRCRYNIDNLVIADTIIRSDNLKSDDYLVSSRQKFKKYMQNKECVSWFNSVSHLVSHDAYGTKKFVLGADDTRFVNYINKKWLVPKGLSKLEQRKYMIWRDSDKDDVVNMADECKLFDLYRSQLTFTKVIKMIQTSLGYEVDTGRSVIEGSQRTYKLVVSYDESKMNCEKSYKGVVNW